MSKFSIIIPTYNRSRALERCLNSLVYQTFNNFEVIVCDDGSVDDTATVIKRFQNKLNLSYNYSKNWGGPAKPRNLGIQLAKGEYVCFLDSDDWWYPNKLAVLNLKLSSDFDVYYHPLLIRSENKDYGLIKCRAVNNNNPKIDLLINLNTLPTSSVCIRANLLKQTTGFSINKEIIGLEDYDFWIKLGNYGAKFKLISEVLGVYFIGSDDNITLEDERQIAKFKTLYELYIQEESLFPFQNRIKSSLAFHSGRIIQDNKLSGNYFKHYLYCLKYGSTRVKLMVIKRCFKF